MLFGPIATSGWRLMNAFVMASPMATRIKFGYPCICCELWNEAVCRASSAMADSYDILISIASIFPTYIFLMAGVCNQYGHGARHYKPENKSWRRGGTLRSQDVTAFSSSTYHEVGKIDLAGVADCVKRRLIVEAMAEAWRAWGVFLVVNHGVGQEVVDRAREQAMRVFALPMETKHKAMREPGGFAGYGNGAGTAVQQSAEHGNESVRVRYPGPDTTNFGNTLWPHDTQGFCERFEAYISASQKLASQLVELLSDGLPEVDRPHIRGYFPEPCAGALRLNYYPVSTTLGLPAHADIAALALLHQCDGGGGLQVEKDGEWVTVQSRSDAFVVIMGTVYQIFTNGDRKACQHRAVQGGDRDRLSVVFSLWPDPSLPMVPALSFKQTRLRYKPVTFPEYWDAREANLLDPLNCIAVDATT